MHSYGYKSCCHSLNCLQLKFLREILLIVCFATNLVAHASLNFDQKVEQLLSRMTLDAKVGQMVQVDAKALKDKEDIQKYCLGSVLSGADSDPPDKGGQTTLPMWIWPDLLSLPKECHESY